MNKIQFMYILQQELKDLNPAEMTDILADFEEHFANGLARGKSETEIAEELGNPADIAQQYRDSISEGTPVRPPIQSFRYQRADEPVMPGAAKVLPGPEVPAAPAAPAAAAAKKINEPALVAVILFNIFLGIPIWISLFSTLFGFWAAAGGIGVAACVLFTVAILQAGVTSLILALFGLALVALTVLAAILMVYLTKWLCIGLKYYVRWNKQLVMGGSLT